MAVGKDLAASKAKAFIALLKKNGIDVSEAYLFGSAVQGLTDENSDIDLAIVSKDFEGRPYYDIRKISPFRREIDLRLEIHPFSLTDTTENPSLFFSKIKRTGIRLN
mgnify:CR=1 FL=1